MMDSKLVLVRGLPGSGKSTLAREIAKACGYVHFESDMFFESEHGYRYEDEQLRAAQVWCLEGARDALMAGGRVVVSNVFCRVEHMREFRELTDDVTVVECTGRYGSTHDIPQEKLQQLEASWEAFEGAICL